MTKKSHAFFFILFDTNWIYWELGLGLVCLFVCFCHKMHTREWKTLPNAKELFGAVFSLLFLHNIAKYKYCGKMRNLCWIKFLTVCKFLREIMWSRLTIISGQLLFNLLFIKEFNFQWWDISQPASNLEKKHFFQYLLINTVHNIIMYKCDRILPFSISSKTKGLIM